MTERWRRELDRLSRAEPDQERLRSLAERGPGLSGGDSAPGRRVAAAALALAVAVASFVLVVTVFRGHRPSGSTTPASSTTTPSPTIAPAFDPAAICRVPKFDPDVALL